MEMREEKRRAEMTLGFCLKLRARRRQLERMQPELNSSRWLDVFIRVLYWECSAVRREVIIMP
jgi:hypothetical protein